MALADLFPDSDYRFQMRFERGDIAQFFAPTPDHELLIKERRHWLRTAPEQYAVLRPEAEPLLHETLELFGQSSIIAPAFSGLLAASPPTECLLELGKALEPDVLLLASGARNGIRLYGGCVCFPSSWSLPEKMGKPIESIHDVVPGLNEQIGRQIHAFLLHLKPGVAWLRSNWGLSRSPELNQHPDRRLPQLQPAVELEDVWLRLEHQALVALPRNRGVLFGIRIAVHPLSEVRAEPVAAKRLVRALRTMPAEVAEYKNLARARERIAELLAS
jgi:hypothetical protein